MHYLLCFASAVKIVYLELLKGKVVVQKLVGGALFAMGFSSIHHHTTTTAVSYMAP